MTLFNLAKWVAKEVTGNKNVDKKIYVVGPAGSGKSMTGLSLANACAKWISFYNHDDFKHASKYFKFDEDHIAVINTDDFIKLMTSYPEKNSVRIIDDCGAAVGFTSRRSMSKENLDIVSIYGTNRVRNCVTIICVQDTNFTDKRMRMLADVIIDMRNYSQNGPLRMGKLWHIRMVDDRKGGYKKCRFMTYECGQWVTQESVACFMPPDDLLRQYNELRTAKDMENTGMLNRKYAHKEEDNSGKMKCVCGSINLYKTKKGWKCKRCGQIIPLPNTNTIISKRIEAN